MFDRIWSSPIAASRYILLSFENAHTYKHNHKPEHLMCTHALSTTSLTHTHSVSPWPPQYTHTHSNKMLHQSTKVEREREIEREKGRGLRSERRGDENNGFKS